MLFGFFGGLLLFFPSVFLEVFSPYEHFGLFVLVVVIAFEHLDEVVAVEEPVEAEVAAEFVLVVDKVAFSRFLEHLTDDGLAELTCYEAEFFVARSADGLYGVCAVVARLYGVEVDSELLCIHVLMIRS